MEKLTCCFIGHRKVDNEEEIRERLVKVVGQLIEQGVTVFYFGSRSDFDNLAWDVVTEYKNNGSDIKRVYVRSAYANIEEFYEKYLLESYEETYMPEGIEDAGRASYVERNQAMIRVNITLLLIAGVPVVTVSNRVGHSRSLTTLNVYADYLGSSDLDASVAINDYFSKKKEIILKA